MTKNQESSHQVLDSIQGYYIWEILGPIINTSVFFFLEFNSKKLLVIQFFYINYACQVKAFHNFLNLVCFTGP